MYKLLIVDDEILALNYIASFPCISEMGFEVVGKGTDGKTGFDLFMELRPDVVITDIKMPGVDGMSMIRNILEVDKKTQIYILTAYSDFEYAKQAFDFGINGYILKHDLDNEVIREILQKVKFVLEKQEEIVQMERHLSLKDIVISQDQEGLREKYRLFKNKYYLPVIVHRSVVLDMKKGSMERVLGESIYTYIKSVISALSKRFEDILFTDINEYGYIILVGVENGSSLFVMEQYLKDIYHEFEKNLSGLKGFGTIIYSLQTYDVQRLHSFYRTYIDNSKNIFRIQDTGLVDIQSIIGKTADSKDYDKALLLIEKLLKKDDIHTAGQEMDILLGRLEECLDNDIVVRIILSLYGMLSAYRSRAMGNMQGFLPIENYVIMTVSSNWEAVAVLNEIRNIINKEYEINRYSPKTNFILQYIQKNYKNDISIEEIAGMLNISTVYASRMFKKEVGINFVEYLTTYRIEQSKILLDTTMMKILEVADRVGYRSSQYFSSLFKKYVGMSPYEYRERKK